MKGKVFQVSHKQITEKFTALFYLWIVETYALKKKTLKGETEDIFFTPQKKYNSFSFFTYIIKKKKHKDEENENNTI